MKRIKILFFISLIYSLSFASDTIFTKQKHSENITDVSVSEDNTLLATASMDKSIFLWSLKSQNFIKKLQGHSQSVNHIQLNNKRKILVSSSFHDGQLIVWNIENGKILKILNYSIKQAHNIAISKNGKFLVLVNNSNIFVYDLVNFKLLYKNKIFNKDIKYSNIFVEFVDEDKKIFLNSPKIGMKLFTFNEGNLQENKLDRFIKGEYIARISNDMSYIAIQAYDYNNNFVDIYDLKTKKRLKRFHGISCFDKRDFIPNSNLFYYNNKVRFSGSAKNRVYGGVEIYNILSGKRVSYNQGSRLNSLSINGKFYIDTTKGLDIYNTLTGKKIASLYPDMYGVTHAVVSKNNIYTHDKLKHLYVWNLFGKREEDNSFTQKVYSISSEDSTKYITYKLHNKIVIKFLETKKVLKIIDSPTSERMKDVFMISNKMLCIVYNSYSLLYDYSNEKIVSRLNIKNIEHVKQLNNNLFVSAANKIYIIDLIQ
jgi:WD40 repeat protein